MFLRVAYDPCHMYGSYAFVSNNKKGSKVGSKVTVIILGWRVKCTGKKKNSLYQKIMSEGKRNTFIIATSRRFLWPEVEEY